MSKKISIKILLAFIIVSVLFSIWSPTVFAQEAETVRVGYFLMDGYQEGAEGEYKSGYGYDYLQEIRNYTGWNYEYVYGNWGELYDMLERGEIDIISHVARTAEYAPDALYSIESQGTESHYLYVRADDEVLKGGDFTQLNGKRVGSLARDYRLGIFKDWCEKQGISCTNVEYTDLDQMHEDFAAGKLDAVNESRAMISAYPGAWKSIIRFEDRGVYFAVNKQRVDLWEQVNEAQAQILAVNEFFGEELQNKYMQNYSTRVLDLTDAEKELLKSRGTLIVGYCDNRRPLAYTDAQTGELAGLVKDYMDIMGDTYGVSFEAISYPDEIALLEALLDKSIDMAVPAAYSASTAESYGLILSDVINQAAMVAVYKGYAGTTPKNIFDSVTYDCNSLTERDYVGRYYPEAEVITANSVDEAIEMVWDGTVDSYIIRSSYWSWYSEDNSHLEGLYAVNVEHPTDVVASMRQEDAALMAILNKGIALLDESQRVQSIVRYSDYADDVTLWNILQKNPVATVLSVLVAVLALVLVFVVSRLKTESKYIEQLKNAKDMAEEARTQAERANLAKSTFMTSMSHDIRTPMNAIIGMTTLAKKHMDEPSYVRNCLNKVTMASNHLLTLINDVLDINKIESGNLSLNITVFSLADSIMNLANISRPQINEKNHGFEIRIHGVGAEHVFADELRINQVFINLLSNAIKYTPAKGQISVDVIAEKKAGSPDIMRLQYIVEDNGIGMSAEFQERMYEVFAMEGNHGRNSGGSGVGLAICKRLVDLMGGTIECVSALGKGTKFTVTLELPIADRFTDHRMLPPIRLLLVDDDRVFLDTASDTLKDMGILPDCVDSGEEAVAKVTEMHKLDKDYPVIIVDWRMPGMDGIQTTKQIRSIVGDEVSIIVISAYDVADVRDAALAAGANGFISKPFFRSNVYDNLSEILGFERQESMAEIQGPNLQGLNLLVAEDNDFNWEIAKDFLELGGMTASRAENGRICLDMLDKAADGEYDLILMDIQMPELNGYETAQAIRAHERLYIKKLPIIAMTADAFTEDVAHCIEVGMNAHMAKPLRLEEFNEVINRIHNSTL